jgi:plastocyanin
MQFPALRRSEFRLLNRCGAALLLTLAGAASGLAIAAPGGIVVSQKGRAFQPGELSLKRGDTVSIVNDDGDLLHHAYVDSETFSFDSGDQEPGSRTDVVFSVAGEFKVLCGIHPKMKLLVHVK